MRGESAWLRQSRRAGILGPARQIGLRSALTSPAQGLGPVFQQPREARRHFIVFDDRCMRHYTTDIAALRDLVHPPPHST